MQIAFDAEQEAFAQAARQVLDRHWSTAHLRGTLLPDGDGHSDELWKELAEAGWLGSWISEQYGGVGATLVETGIAFREAGRALVPTTLASTVHAALLIDALGTDAQKDAWLPRIAAGEVVATVAFAEPQAELSACHLQAVATPIPSGWSLNGVKTYVQNAARADLMVVASAVADRGRRGPLGYFLVTPNDGARLEKHSTFARDSQATVRLGGMQLERDALLGELRRVGETASVSDSVLDTACALQCMEMLGGGEKVLEMTCEHVLQREQFGRQIGTFQAVQHIVANIGSLLQGGRVAALRALWLVSVGRPATREVSIAKAWLNKTYVEATVWAHQLHGGMGYVREMDLHLWSERAMALELRNGNTDFHLRRIAAATVG